MCDYSLMAIPNRLARDGEELVTHRFHTGTIGLASRADLQIESQPEEGPKFWAAIKKAFTASMSKPVCAVCIPPGSSLLLQDIPESLQREMCVGPVEHVTFTQMSADTNRYRDAVRFSNGREVLLQRLREGQRVRVLSGVKMFGTEERITDRELVHR
jgi:hypothetical protein